MKNLIKKIDWNKNSGLAPAIVQDADSNVVLMLGYMNRQSFAKTLKTEKVWFYSRNKKRLWMKGETSGNILKLIDIKTDCDNDTLLIKVKPAGPTCHIGSYSCFKESKQADELSELFKIIQDRKNAMPKNSYSTFLFKQGLDKISLKVAEEALEVVQAAQKQTKRRLVEESVDLIYHLWTLLVFKRIDLSGIYREIKKRKN